MNPRARGFTLLELLIVVSIVALATAGVSLSLRDTRATALEHEALRLTALLDSARAQSRASGAPVRWLPTAQGFEFQGLPTRDGAGDALASQRHWLSEDTQARVVQPPGTRELLLGPEPLIAAQRIELVQGERRLIVGTDGLAPFAVVTETAGP
ncbi:prepilin-type N-terminal cleavage/methylation domain-containing protein [Hydrogenophaga sp.]|uniref:prepilin-type N-terminal cleavage/methylation domain-containing protein n=1 Tax=Hydrogenophaga sp. TaxID=1904254 RepID=UPI0035B42295